MASQLKVDTLTGVTTAGSIDVTGEGNSTTTNLQQGLAKCWAQIEGNITSYRDSFNTSSLTDISAGRPRVTYTNNMANDDASLTMSHQNTTALIASLAFNYLIFQPQYLLNPLRLLDLQVSPYNFLAEFVKFVTPI